METPPSPEVLKGFGEDIQRILQLKNTERLDDEYISMILCFEDDEVSTSFIADVVNDLNKNLDSETSSELVHNIIEAAKRWKEYQNLCIEDKNEKLEESRKNESKQMKGKRWDQEMKSLKFALNSRNSFNSKNRQTNDKTSNMCNCRALIHPFVRNCTFCGKIICSKEIDEKCSFCHKIATPVDNSKIVATTSSYRQASNLKDRLLQNDKESSKMNVIDDQSTWYSESKNVWLDESERAFAAENAKQIEKKKREAKHTVTVEIDLNKGKLIEEKKEIEDDFLDFCKKREVKGASFEAAVQIEEDEYDGLPQFRRGIEGNPYLNGEAQQLYEELVRQPMESPVVPTVVEEASKEVINLQKKRMNGVSHGSTSNLKVKQDTNDELLAIPPIQREVFKDVQRYPSMKVNYCLALHQPVASNMISLTQCSLKMFSATRYRGRVWICSTVNPNRSCAAELYDEVKEVYENPPRTALLGCSNLKTCVRQIEKNGRKLPLWTWTFEDTKKLKEPIEWIQENTFQKFPYDFGVEIAKELC